MTTTLTPNQLESIIEAALMVSGQPLTVAQIQKLFSDDEVPTTQEVRATLTQLQERYAERGVELQEVASGFQFQTKASMSPWLSRLWEERPPRYSRAFLETLAIIAYRQPVTRAEIEDIRGVSIATSIFKTLLERDWIKCVGYKDVPGKPAIYGTTKTFLDHFKMKTLRELPTLSEVQAVAIGETAPVQLAFDNEFAPAVEEGVEEVSETLELQVISNPEESVSSNEEQFEDDDLEADEDCDVDEENDEAEQAEEAEESEEESSLTTA